MATFTAGTVLTASGQSADTAGAGSSERIASFEPAYKITALPDWLFEQTPSASARRLGRPGRCESPRSKRRTARPPGRGCRRHGGIRSGALVARRWSGGAPSRMRARPAGGGGCLRRCTAADEPSVESRVRGLIARTCRCDLGDRDAHQRADEETTPQQRRRPNIEALHRPGDTTSEWTKPRIRGPGASHTCARGELNRKTTTPDHA